MSKKSTGMMQVLLQAIGAGKKYLGKNMKHILPWKELGIATGAGIGGGVLMSAISDATSKKGEKLKRNIQLYRDIESPLADEDSAIDASIEKNSSALVDIPVWAASLAIPGLMGLSQIKDAAQKKKTNRGRKEVGALRDMVDKAYREDLMKAYGIQNEEALNQAVEELRTRAGELDKTSATIPLSPSAAIAAASALGLASFVGAKNKSDANDPNRIQNKNYLKKLDRLYRERLISPTIRELPFSDEELLAMELYKQEGRKAKRAPESEGPKAVIEEAPEPDFEPVVEQLEEPQEVSMDDEDIQSIIKEL